MYFDAIVPATTDPCFWRLYFEEERLRRLRVCENKVFHGHGDVLQRTYRIVILDKFSDSKTFRFCHTIPVPLAMAKSGSSGLIKGNAWL
jgi:hypothetical protein